MSKEAREGAHRVMRYIENSLSMAPLSMVEAEIERQIDAAHAPFREKVVALVTVANSCEWSGADPLGAPCCPICGAEERDGHVDECELIASLRAVKEAMNT